MKTAEISIGTIIYVVIFAIVSIVSAINKKAKKARSAEVQQPEKPVKTWEEILAETLDIPRAHEPVTVSEPVRQQAETRNIKNSEDEAANRKLSAELPDRLNKLKHGEYHSIDMTKIAQSTLPGDEIANNEAIEFDVRKAVIFSEILNKKF